MATVIRDAVIRIGLQQIPTELKAPNVQPITQAQDAITRKAAETKDALEVANKKIQDFAQAWETAQARSSQSLLKAGQSAFQFARGVAFMAASTSDDLQKVLTTLALFQGGFDILKGGVQTVRHLSAAFENAANVGGVLGVVLSNPLTAGLLAVTAALAGAIAYWKSTGETMDDVRARSDRLGVALRRNALSMEQHGGIATARSQLEGGNLTGSIETLAQLAGPRSTIEDELTHERELLDLQRKKTQEAINAADAEERLITQRQHELQIANDLYKVESDKVKSIEA
jgi:hypothetical protein